MKVANIKQTTAERVINSVAIGILGGETAKLIHYNRLPDNIKFAFNNANKSHDAFVSEAMDCAIRTKNSLKNSKMNIDIDNIFENASKMYPELIKDGKKAYNAVKKTGIIAAAIFTVAAALGHFIIEPKIKENKQK